MSLTICNDRHIGAIRTGGTTPSAAYQLRLDLLSEFEEELYAVNNDLMLLGDLCDSADINKADLLRLYQILDDWLVRTGRSLFAVAGNHDVPRRSDQLSSFQLLIKLLQGEGQYAGTVHYISEGTLTPYGYVIGHVLNQDLFDLELSKVPECDYLYLHCNYNNKFAVEADHSLNLSQEQAEALPVKHIVLAHEHQQRTELKGKVIVIGNQRPSSISDALNNDTKRCMTIKDTGHEFIETWKAEGDYIELPWQDLKDTGARFVRAVGSATADEAAQVVTAIARFRAQSAALIVGNAVKVEGVNDTEDLALSHEQIQTFDVQTALFALLSPEEVTKLRKLQEM
jgi:DNA repair exonuclease SbcCD nuclease subunit